LRALTEPVGIGQAFGADDEPRSFVDLGGDLGAQRVEQPAGTLELDGERAQIVDAQPRGGGPSSGRGAGRSTPEPAATP